MAKRKGKLGPKQRRMKREARLQSAKSWLKGYEGKNVVKSYSKWFAVDQICAMKELEVLGLHFSEKQKMNIQIGYENRVRQKQLLKAGRLEKERERELEEYYQGFGFIEDFTEGGAPFGLTDWELEKIEARERERAQRVRSLTNTSLYWVDEQLECEGDRFYGEDDHEMPSEWLDGCEDFAETQLAAEGIAVQFSLIE